MRVATLIQQQFLPRELPEPAASGRSPPTTVRPARSAATSTTSSRCATGGSASSSATSPTRACRRRWSWPGPIPSCAAEATAADSPGEILARANELLVPEMPARMFVTCLFGDPRARRPAGSCSPTPATTCPTSAPTTGVIELRATGMPARPHARHRVRGDRGRRRPGRQRAALLRRAWSRQHGPDRRDVRLPAPARGDGRATTPAASCSTACSTSSARSPARAGSRRTTSRS